MVEVTKKKIGGLAGVVAGDSAICSIDVEEEGLRYRGYAIEELAEYASFEEVAWLLLRGDLPNRAQLEGYYLRLEGMRTLPLALREVLERIPKTSSMMDVLRTGCSFLGNIEPEKQAADPFYLSDRLLACFSSMLFYWFHFHHSGKRIETTTPEKTVAGHILYLLRGMPPEELSRRALEVSLILYAEHEFNASTFTARTIASTLADFYSAVTGAIGALSGALHGGANEKALEHMLLFRDPQQAEEGTKRMLEEKKLIMGFGHRVYTTHDPRSPIMHDWAKKLSVARKNGTLLPIAERIEEVLWKEKKLFPNADFYSAVVYHFLGFSIQMFTPLFIISRITGWSAHILEQRANNKLIRPTSHYTGHEAQPWIPLENR